MTLFSVLRRLDRFVKFDEVSAHCDIPCKIYDPHSAQLAVLTMIRSLDLIQELQSSLSEDLAAQAQLNRLIAQKEQHGIAVKEAISVIWGDYIKSPQLEQFPEIHNLTHEIMLTASRAKQGLDRDAAILLLEKVNRFADIFWQTKGIPTFKATCPYPPSLSVVYPDLKKG